MSARWQVAVLETHCVFSEDAEHQALEAIENLGLVHAPDPGRRQAPDLIAVMDSLWSRSFWSAQRSEESVIAWSNLSLLPRKALIAIGSPERVRARARVQPHCRA